jgi:hypothetical protein
MPWVAHAGAGTGIAFKQVPGSPADEEFIIQWANGKQVAFGVGTTDTDQTYIRIHDEDGDNRYIDVTDTTLAASATRP